MSIRKIMLVLAVLVMAVPAQASDLTKWARFDAGGHPDYVSVPSLQSDVIWCVWHEGLRVYKGNSQIPINTFRQACMSLQDHNPPSYDRVKNATNNNLTEALDTMRKYFAIEGNGGYEMVFKQLIWVLDHEGQREKVLDLLEKGRFEPIRSIYYSEQDHHAHVKNMLSAIDDSTLQQMINDMKK